MSPSNPRWFRPALILSVCGFVLVVGGYQVGKQLAGRDNARAAQTSVAAP